MSVLSLLPEEKKKDSRKESLETVYSSNSRLSLLHKRKRHNPHGDMAQAKGDRFVTQRVLSAKTHRVKQLQSQLSDAHYHLQELSNENRILRAIQKKQETALQRYESSSAELPSVLNSHSEEIRAQQARYKQLKQQFKEVTQKLKERDMQYQQIKDEHQHLLELSKDRNLLEREKLQAQVIELTAKVKQQNETISMLQRKITLEAKNFKHQLQMEINKHKDTRHDLELAIGNADKLSTIIEMKEKLLSTAASRNTKSPVKTSSMTNSSRPATIVAKSQPARPDALTSLAREDVERSNLSRLCENSRNITSALSHEDESICSAEPRSRFNRMRSSSNSTTTRSTPNTTRKSSKGSEEMNELAKTIQEGMNDLTIFDELEDTNGFSEEMQKKMDIMKADLMNKIKHDKTEDPVSKKPSLIRRQSTESAEEEIIEEVERPKSRVRRGSSVSFYDGAVNINSTTIEETTTTIAINDYRSGGGDELDREKAIKPKRETSGKERKLSGKSVDRYCQDIMQDIENSSKVIDKHMRQFSYSKFEGDKLVEQLQAVDKLNDFVSSGDIPEDTLEELNNNFKLLTDNVFEAPSGRKRSVANRRGSGKSRNDVLGDAALSNQDLLNDLLGKK